MKKVSRKSLRQFARVCTYYYCVCSYFYFSLFFSLPMTVFVCLSVQLPTFEVLLSILFLLRFELFCFFFCSKNLRIYGQQAVKTWKECLSPESCCQCPAILSTNALTRPLDSQIFLVLSRCTSLLSTLSHWVLVIDGRNWVGVLERCLRIFCQRVFP